MWKYENTYHLVSQHIINTWKNPVFCTWLLLSPPLCLSANVSLAETRHDHLDKWHSQSPVYMLPCFIFLHGTYHHQVYVYLIIRYYLSPIPLLCCCLDSKSCPTPLQHLRLEPTRLCCPLDFPGKNIAVGCHFLIQRISLTQGSNLDLLHCRQNLYCSAIGEALAI